MCGCIVCVHGQMDHLVCFLAGTLALGAQTTDDPVRRDRDMKTAKVKRTPPVNVYIRRPVY